MGTIEKLVKLVKKKKKSKGRAFVINTSMVTVNCTKSKRGG